MSDRLVSNIFYFHYNYKIHLKIFCYYPVRQLEESLWTLKLPSGQMYLVFNTQRGCPSLYCHCIHQTCITWAWKLERRMNFILASIFSLNSKMHYCSKLFTIQPRKQSNEGPFWPGNRNLTSAYRTWSLLVSWGSCARLSTTQKALSNLS